MGAYQNIRDKLEAKLNAVSDINEVYDYPKMDFGGYPAAVIIPTEGESDWETNKDDQRAYVFDVLIYYEMNQATPNTALDRLMDVCDDVLDSFASDKQLSGISLPANKTIITVDPVFAGYETVPDKELLVARIKVKVIISIAT